MSACINNCRPYDEKKHGTASTVETQWYLTTVLSVYARQQSS